VLGGNGQSCGKPAPYGVLAAFASDLQVLRSAASEKPSPDFFSLSASLEPPQPARPTTSTAAPARATVRDRTVIA
jgi:hypothetical protein